MKAIVVRTYGSAEEAMQLETLADPEPGPKDVVVQVEACGVCFHDVVTRNGTMKAGVELPIVPGHEVSGTVVGVGREVTQFKAGDRVASAQRSHICGHCAFCSSGREPLCDEAVFLGDVGLNGGYAEYTRIEEDNLAPVPEELPLDATAIAACAIGTMYHAIREVGRVQLGERVLVTGASGGLGMHGIQLAKHAGAIVVALTTSPDKAERLRELGADTVVVAERGGDFSAEVKEVTESRGVDVVIDNVGSPIFTSIRRSLAKCGRWVLVGQLTGDFIPFNPAQLFLKSISLLSATSTTRQELAGCLDLLRQGAVMPIVDRTLPLGEAAVAHRLLEAGATSGRILLKPGEASP